MDQMVAEIQALMDKIGKYAQANYVNLGLAGCAEVDNAIAMGNTAIQNLNTLGVADDEGVAEAAADALSTLQALAEKLGVA